MATQNVVTRQPKKDIRKRLPPAIRALEAEWKQLSQDLLSRGDPKTDPRRYRFIRTITAHVGRALNSLELAQTFVEELYEDQEAHR